MKDKIKAHFEGNYLSFYEKHLKSIKHIGGEEYMAPCPFHDEVEPSFNFNSQKGTYLCRGCGKKGHAFHFFAKISSLDTRRDFRKILKGVAEAHGIPWEEEKAKLAATYDYYDLAGNLAHQTLRYEYPNGRKEFKQRRPAGNGGWIWKNVFKDFEPILYRLPELPLATEVILVEGEKDADNLAALGFVATTNPMGANAWRDSYNNVFKSKHVVLIPDNDNEGRELMAKVGAAINDVAASLKWIDLPDIASKGDASDWIAMQGDPEGAAEKLAIMIDNAGTYEPPKPVSWDDAVLEDKEFITLDLPEKKTIVIPWLPEQSISLISGWRGVGKTWFAMGLLDATTKGHSFGPWEINEPVPCLYLEGEMPYQDVRERFLDLNHPKLERKAPLHILSDAYANELGLPRSHLLNEKWRTIIKRILTTRKIKLWVLDNLASLASGIDENSKKEWDPINQWLLELRFAGIATVMLHHTNKEGDQRGTSAREDNIDCSILLKQPFGYVPEDGARFVAVFKKARVRTQDLSLIGDTQFQLCQDPSEQLTWTHGNVRKETKVEVLKLLDEDHKAIDIASMLGISRGRVSQITKQAHKDGFITGKGKLTQSGYQLIQGTED